MRTKTSVSIFVRIQFWEWNPNVSSGRLPQPQVQILFVVRMLDEHTRLYCYFFLLFSPLAPALFQISRTERLLLNDTGPTIVPCVLSFGPDNRKWGGLVRPRLTSAGYCANCALAHYATAVGFSLISLLFCLSPTPPNYEHM